MAVGEWLVAHQVVPRAAVVSPAQRTRRTWELAAAQLPAPVPVQFDDAVYEADWTDLLAVAQGLPEDADIVVLVGHNPGSEDLASRLAGPGSDQTAVARMRQKYPTAGIAVIDVPGSWADLAAGSGVLRDFDAPRG